MDKTNSELPLLDYKLYFNFLVGVYRFDPTALPPIDFQLGWKLVKKQFGEDFPLAQPNRLTLASVSVLQPDDDDIIPVASFNVKLVDDPSEFCWEYIYDPENGTAERSSFIPPCWFDMDAANDPCLIYWADRTTCNNPEPNEQ